jgi:hypothetical protein
MRGRNGLALLLAAEAQQQWPRLAVATQCAPAGALLPRSSSVTT